MRSHVAVLLAVAAAALLPTGTAAAAGPPILTVTEHPVDDVVTQLDRDPCTGAPILLTARQTGVLHVTRFADGTVHFTVTLHADYVADLYPDGGRDGVGSYVVHAAGNGALNTDGSAFGRAEGSYTLDGTAIRPDGSTDRFHRNTHTVFGPDGLPAVDLAHATCR